MIFTSRCGKLCEPRAVAYNSIQPAWSLRVELEQKTQNPLSISTADGIRIASSFVCRWRLTGPFDGRNDIMLQHIGWGICARSSASIIVAKYAITHQSSRTSCALQSPYPSPFRSRPRFGSVQAGTWGDPWTTGTGGILSIRYLSCYHPTLIPLTSSQ